MAQDENPNQKVEELLLANDDDKIDIALKIPQQGDKKERLSVAASKKIKYFIQKGQPQDIVKELARVINQQKMPK